MILHKNVDLIGRKETAVNAWKMHNLKRAYLETGLQIKVSEKTNSCEISLKEI